MRLTTVQAVGLGVIGLVALGCVFAILLPLVYPDEFGSGAPWEGLAVFGYVFVGVGILSAWVWVQSSIIHRVDRGRGRVGPLPPSPRKNEGLGTADGRTVPKSGHARLLWTAAFAALLFLGEGALLALAANRRGTPPMPFDWVGFSFVIRGIGLADFFLIYYFSTRLS